MIQLTSATAIESAITKARTVKPRVHVNCFGSYTVTCEKRDGKRFASCTCRAGELGRACYHLAAAVSAHIQLADDKQAAN
jgi:uncharacterized Zn finger protein